MVKKNPPILLVWTYPKCDFFQAVIAIQASMPPVAQGGVLVLETWGCKIKLCWGHGKVAPSWNHPL